ncbi:MAG TPA: ABC transporter ATP-binding protein [Ktedonobacterales bacterium]|nr:ABC transporter ATP-binding protein [Ktedonobacterales bacterium]
MGTNASVIVAENLRKYYGETKAVDGISLEVAEGEIFGMLGPNGAGKSTTIEMLEGLRTIDSGAALILGLTQPRDAKAIKSRIGIQLQATALYPRLTVTEILDLFHTFYRNRQTLPTAELIRLVDLDEKRDTRSKALSGGQKQRLSVALALVNDPDIVFLDEPTTGMDPQARRQLWDVIADLRKRGKTILLTTHYMEEAQQLCDRVAVIDHGKIIETGSPAELIRRHFSEIAIQFQDGHGSDAYATLPGVTHVAAEDDRVTVYSTDVPRTMAALLEREVRAGDVLQDLSVHGATLEDVFLKLTGRALRD